MCTLPDLYQNLSWLEFGPAGTISSWTGSLSQAAKLTDRSPA